jgi:ketosteroid isomerase-like protein
MSQENVEVVQRAIAAVNERDVDGYLACCTPDMELVSPIAPLEGSASGAEGIRQWFAGLDEAQAEFRLDIESLRAVGEDRVLALVQVVTVSRGGIPYSQPAANVYDLVGAKLRRVRVYLDRNAALEAVGLRE